jgi:hypothetical protein
METRGSGYEEFNEEMESLQFYRELLALKHLPGHERDTPLGPLSPFMNMENAVRFILGRPVSWYCEPMLFRVFVSCCHATFTVVMDLLHVSAVAI